MKKQKKEHKSMLVLNQNDLKHLKKNMIDFKSENFKLIKKHGNVNEELLETNPSKEKLGILEQKPTFQSDSKNNFTYELTRENLKALESQQTHIEKKPLEQKNSSNENDKTPKFQNKKKKSLILKTVKEEHKSPHSSEKIIPQDIKNKNLKVLNEKILKNEKIEENPPAFKTKNKKQLTVKKIKEDPISLHSSNNSNKNSKKIKINNLEVLKETKKRKTLKNFKSEKIDIKQQENSPSNIVPFDKKEPESSEKIHTKKCKIKRKKQITNFVSEINVTKEQSQEKLTKQKNDLELNIKKINNVDDSNKDGKENIISNSSKKAERGRKISEKHADIRERSEKTVLRKPKTKYISERISPPNQREIYEVDEQFYTSSTLSHFELFRLKTLIWAQKKTDKRLVHTDAGYLYENYHIDSFNLNAIAQGENLRAFKGTWKAAEDIIIFNSETKEIISKWQLKHYKSKYLQNLTFQKEKYIELKKCGLFEDLELKVTNKIEEFGVSSEPITDHEIMIGLAEEKRKSKEYIRDEIEKILMKNKNRVFL